MRTPREERRVVRERRTILGRELVGGDLVVDERHVVEPGASRAAHGQIEDRVGGARVRLQVAALHLLPVLRPEDAARVLARAAPLAVLVRPLHDQAGAHGRHPPFRVAHVLGLDEAGGAVPCAGLDGHLPRHVAGVLLRIVHAQGHGPLPAVRHRSVVRGLLRQRPARRPLLEAGVGELHRHETLARPSEQDPAARARLGVERLVDRPLVPPRHPTRFGGVSARDEAHMVVALTAHVLEGEGVALQRCEGILRFRVLEREAASVHGLELLSGRDQAERLVHHRPRGAVRPGEAVHGNVEAVLHGTELLQDVHVHRERGAPLRERHGERHVRVRPGLGERDRVPFAPHGVAAPAERPALVAFRPAAERHVGEELSPPVRQRQRGVPAARQHPVADRERLRGERRTCRSRHHNHQTGCLFHWLTFQYLFEDKGRRTNDKGL